MTSLKGTIIMIGEEQKFDSGFRKKEFVIETSGDYPQKIKFEVTKNNIEKCLEGKREGDVVDVEFNIRGNEYNGKYFVNLSAWKVTTELP